MTNDKASIHLTQRSIFIGALAWVFGGIFGFHRFYYKRPVSGTLWMFTCGLFLVGWLVDLFKVAQMHESTDVRSRTGPTRPNVGWVLLMLGGFLGMHRMYMDKWGTGILYLLTLGVFGFGILYDLWTLDAQINERNAQLSTVSESITGESLDQKEAYFRNESKQYIFDRKLAEASNRLKRLLKRVASMESYVTSNRYLLRREFSNLDES